MVDFHGDDGRRRTFDVGQLPMPSWHPLLAEALALRIGPSGSVRALSGAKDSFRALKRWTRFLNSAVPRPETPDQLVRSHVDAFHARVDVSERSKYVDMKELRRLFADEHLKGRLPADAADAFRRRLVRPAEAVGGYSRGELERLTAAARADAARIARRIRAGEELVRRWQADPDQMDPQGRALGEVLATVAATGVVPRGSRAHRRAELASHLFLRWKDLAPLMVLLALVTERNGETLKELPARHRVLEGRAVELVVVKRRHGAQRWFETVTWEIGPKERELHTPGGLYLLVLELTARSRALCGSTAAFSFWHNDFQAADGRDEHWAPFELDLTYGTNIEMSTWAATRSKPVLTDPRLAAHGQKATAGNQEEESIPVPLKVTFNQIKTSVDARRVKELGGHLPSAAKSNTAQTLFTNYLKPDESTREWAEEVISKALADAEKAAWDAHAAAVQRRGSPKVITDTAEAGLAPQTARELADGGLDTAWAACEDHDHHPETGTACGDSFLACFHCGNCLITRTHLPRLLALLDTLGTLRQRMTEDAWWERYGPAWVAIRRDILAKFTEAEVARARKQQLPDALLDLVEAPWEQP